MTREDALKVLDTIPTIGEQVDALEMAIKALEQETCDCISREEAIRMFADDDYTVNELRNLPPVTPQPKIGRWIKEDGFDGDTYYDCSKCGESWTTIDGTPWDNGMKFCPNCGAKMEVEE